MGGEAMISYEELERRLSSKGLKRSDLTAALGISSRTIAKIAKVLGIEFVIVR
jgi:DNA-binding Xre family transcriptional regulator